MNLHNHPTHTHLFGIFIPLILLCTFSAKADSGVLEDSFSSENLDIYVSDQLLQENMHSDVTDIDYFVKVEGFVDGSDRYFRLGWNSSSYFRDLRIAVVDNPKGYRATAIAVDVRMLSSTNKSTETIKVYSKGTPFSDSVNWDGISSEGAQLNTSVTQEFKRGQGKVEIPLNTPAQYICIYLDSRRVAFNSLSIIWDSESGIDTQTISSDEASTPLFFNLQGIPVATPTPGIYIKYENGTYSKVFIR